MHHFVDHCPADHRFAAFWLELIVFTQSPILIQPGKSPFDYPAFGQRNKAFLVREFVDNLERPPTEIGEDILEMTGVSAIGINRFEAVATLLHLWDQAFGSLAFGNRGGGHFDRPNQAKTVDAEMAFASFDLLCGVIADSFFRFGRSPFSVVLTD